MTHQNYNLNKTFSFEEYFYFIMLNSVKEVISFSKAFLGPSIGHHENTMDFVLSFSAHIGHIIYAVTVRFFMAFMSTTSAASMSTITV